MLIINLLGLGYTQSPELLIEEFVKFMDSKGLISSMTGCIFLNPVMIEGTSEPQEREFIEKSVATTGKNPFTNKPMTLSDLKNKEDIKDIISQIKTLCDEFLETQALHPQLDKIKELLSNGFYKIEPNTIRPGQGPTDPDNDDLLAMQLAANYTPQFFTPGFIAARTNHVNIINELSRSINLIPQ